MIFGDGVVDECVSRAKIVVRFSALANFTVIPSIPSSFVLSFYLFSFFNRLLSNIHIIL